MAGLVLTSFQLTMKPSNRMRGTSGDGMRGLRLFKPAVERELTSYEMECVEYALNFFVVWVGSHGPHSEAVLRQVPGCESVLEKLSEVQR
jgi:hypothetical protein